MAVQKTPPPQAPVPQPPQAPAQKKTFEQQMFGPWSTLDPHIQRTIVRTNASSGITQRKFQASYPPAPTINETRTALGGAIGFEFAINVVSSRNVTGYNVYSSTINNPNVAKLVQFVSQPPNTNTTQSLKIQDITAASPFYWVASVNGAGRESSRVPIAGTAAPMPPPTNPVPPGGSSGGGSSGGRGGSGGGTRIFR